MNESETMVSSGGNLTSDEWKDFDTNRNKPLEILDDSALFKHLQQCFWNEISHIKLSPDTSSMIGQYRKEILGFLLVNNQNKDTCSKQTEEFIVSLFPQETTKEEL